MMRKFTGVALAVMMGSAMAQDNAYLDGLAERWVDPQAWEYDIQLVITKRLRDPETGEQLAEETFRDTQYTGIDYASMLHAGYQCTVGEGEVWEAWHQNAIEQDPQGAGSVGARAQGQ